jgi:opacity protein-like surface antigen
MSSKLRPAVTFVCVLASPALYGAEDATGTTQPDTDSDTQAELTQLSAEAQDGYRMGSFTVRPEVAVSGVYDSNIFATPTEEVEDSILLFAPTLAADSGWARHKLEFDLGGAFARYSSNDDEDYDDYWASAEGRYDLSDNTNLFGGLGYSHQHEDRGSPEDEQAGDEPTVYDSSRAHAGISQDWGKLGVRLGGTYEDLQFDNAGTLNNSDRDRALTGAGGRVSWQLHPQYTVYGQGVLDQRDYDKSPDDNGYQRDSDGYRAVAGVLATFTNRLKGEAYLGYLSQAYDDARFDDVSEPDYGGSLSWRPSPRTIVAAELERSLEETTLAGSSGYLYTALGGSVRHKLTPRMNVNVGVSAAEAEYNDISREDHYYSAWLGMRYYLTTRWYLGGEYRVLVRDSSSDGQVNNPASQQELEDYGRNQFFLTLGTLLYPVKPGAYWNAPSGQALPLSGAVAPGFYAGALLGYDSLNLRTKGGRDQATDKGELSDSDASAGLFAGYGLNWGRWYAGLEADYEDSRVDVDYSEERLGSRTLGIDKNASYGLAVRGGYQLAGGSLLYARAGGVRTSFDLYDTVNARTDAAEDDDTTETGVRFGLGTDIPATRHIFVRLDYSFTQYDDIDANIVDSQDQPQTERFRPREDLFRVGLGWQWGGAGERRATQAGDYSGLYAGAHIGHGALQSDLSGQTNDAGATPAEPGPFCIAGEFGDDSAVTGGVFFGYGLQHRQWYLGVEGELEDANADWAATQDPDGREFSVEKMETWGAALRGGYVLDNGSLLYARAGKVRTRFNTTWVRGSDPLNYVDRDDRRSGDRLGVGAELPVSRSAFVRLDYSYTDYNSYEFATSHPNPDSIEFDNDESLFRLGLGVRF